MSGDGFPGLLEKYIEIRALRLLAQEGDSVDPRPRMRALAARFPGALRELDELPIEVIEARIERLEAGERPLWAELLVAYHGWMRVGLRVKRTHGKRAETATVSEWLEATHRPRDGEPSLEELDGAAVEAFLRPPGGRLSRWVLERIAHDRRVGLDRVEAEAFGTGNH